MNLTIKQLLALQLGLRNLDGYERIIKDGDRERTANVRYNLTASMRRLISKNLKAIAPLIDDYEEARTALILSLARADGSNEVPKDKMNEFTIEDNKLRKETRDIEPIQFTEADLKLDDNPIPSSVLELLEPLIL